MRQQLENMAGMHQPRVSEQRQQTYFVVGDLESLSASALYDEIKKGDYIKSNDQTLNFYHLINLKNFGETEVGLQEDHEKHSDFKKRMIKDGGYRIGPAIKLGS